MTTPDRYAARIYPNGRLLPGVKLTPAFIGAFGGPERLIGLAIAVLFFGANTLSTLARPATASNQRFASAQSRQQAVLFEIRATQLLQ